MSAATSNIDTPQRAGETLSLPVVAPTHIYAGTLVAIDAVGNAQPASNVVSRRVVGRAEEEVNNTGSAGALRINVRRGVFRFAQDGNALAIGDLAYVMDDSTVKSTGSKNLIAGRVVGLEGTANAFAWIDTHPALYAAASA